MAQKKVEVGLRASRYMHAWLDVLLFLCHFVYYYQIFYILRFVLIYVLHLSLLSFLRGNETNCASLCFVRESTSISAFDTTITPSSILFLFSAYFRWVGRRFNELCAFLVRWLLQITVIREISAARTGRTVVNRAAPIR